MAQQQEVPISENLNEIRTLSDEEVVSDWAVGNKISADAVEKLFKEGFTSIEAIKLLDSDDLSRSKIPRGQQKLILASVKKLLIAENRAGIPAHAQQAGSDHVGVESFPSGSGSIGGQAIQSESSHRNRNNDDSNNGVDLGAGGILPPTTDPFSVLLNNIQQGQSLARTALGASNVQAPNQAGSDLSELGIPMNTGNHLGQSKTQTSSHSWRDPQVFLEYAASGKSVSTHHDITDFVNNSVEEVVVVGGNGTQ